MTERRSALVGLGAALLVVVLSFGAGRWQASATESSPPSAQLEQWAMASLHARRLGRPAPAGPEQRFEPTGPTVVTVWHQGGVIARHVGRGELASVLEAASQEFSGNRSLRGLPAWVSDGADAVRFTVEVTLGEAPLVLGIPYLEALSLVPLHDGVGASFEGREVVVSVEELRGRSAFDRGIPTPIPDLTLGVDMNALLGRLARELGTSAAELVAQGDLRRLRMHRIAEDSYPGEVTADEETLRRAAVEGAEFLLRHQSRDGRYTYIYDARQGQSAGGGYNIPRHSGTTYFLAQVDHLEGHPPSRSGALQALRWLERTRVRQCGENLCIEDGGRVDVGSAALTVVAAAELLRKRDNPLPRRLLEGLTGFLMAQQRPDGELMHEYDLAAQAPIDVQHLYYSGEAAFALFQAHAVLDDPAVLEAAQRLMAHLTGAGWDFLGSRYYYGEEHWTCIAAGSALGKADTDAATDFCGRWFGFNDGLQYRTGQTPWDVEGAYGVGPLIVPRLTPVGSRTEAFIGTYELFQHHGRPTGELRALIERGLRQLLRWRWAPGPTHLFADPAGARGGVPGSPVDLHSRNDFVQHAGSAWIRWADILRREREAQAD